MSDIVYAGVSHDPAAPVYWLRANASGDVIAMPGAGTLEQLASFAGGAPVTLILNLHDATLSTTDLPVTGKKLLQALPFALEEQFPGDIEHLHFAAGPRDEDGRRRVAVVPREKLADILERLRAAGIEVRQAFLMQDALVPLPGQVQAVLLGDQTMVAAPHQLPVTFHTVPPGPVVDACLRAERDAVDDAASTPLQLQVYCDAEAETTHATTLQAWQDAEIPCDVRQLSQGWFGFAARALLARPGVDLLQGNFAIRADTMAALRPWAMAAGLLIAIGVLGLVNLAVEGFSLQRRAAVLDQHIATALQRINGSKADPVVAEAQLSAVLRQAGLGNRASSGTAADGGSAEFLTALEALSGAVRTADGTDVDAISFSNGVLDVQLATSSAVTLEAMKDRISADDRLEASILRTESEDDGVAGRLQIRAAAP